MTRMPENPSDWYSEGTDVSPYERIEFTQTPYEDPANGISGIGTYGNLFEPYLTAYAPNSTPAAAATCEWSESSDLPFDIEGIITLHPRYYYKTDGCADSREKYYGSYFIEDSTGGFFVLGDSKVGHFTMGDRVRLRVHGIREAYDMPMVINAEILDVDRTTNEIYFKKETKLNLPGALPPGLPGNDFLIFFVTVLSIFLVVGKK